MFGKKKIRLGVIYGSRSVEHEVSVITALQFMKHADRTKYDVIPLYIDKVGRWLTGAHLEQKSAYSNLETVHEHSILFSPTRNGSEHSFDNVDVAIVCCHGTLGEDGTVQGLLDLNAIPYQGPGVLGSALCMDKIATKMVLQSAGIPIVPFHWFTSAQWKENSKHVLQSIEALKYPLFVKPANMGSSIGINKAKDLKDLKQAIEIALHFDRRILVEEGQVDCIEINASVLGFQIPEVSTLEQPIKTDEILSYADKYERGGGKKSGMASLQRRIPAPISSTLTRKIQDFSRQAFVHCDCSGVVRIDFLVDPISEEVWVNEINTIPGSMSFYLWEATKLPYSKLIDKLVSIAQERTKVQLGYTRSIKTKIL